MTIRRKKKLDVKVRTRQLIIDEAERIIAEQGIDGLKLDDIAGILGIRRPSLYTHFKGGDGILTAIAERAFNQLSLLFEDDENPDPVVTISKGVGELVSYLVQHKAYARLLARDLSTPGGLSAVNAILGEPETQMTPKLLQPLYKRLDNIIARGHGLGRFRQVDSFVFLTTLLGSIVACELQHRRQLRNLDEMMTRLALGFLASDQRAARHMNQSLKS